MKSIERLNDYMIDEQLKSSTCKRFWSLYHNDDNNNTTTANTTTNNNNMFLSLSLNIHLY